jgi:hypothetical protein
MARQTARRTSDPILERLGQLYRRLLNPQVQRTICSQLLTARQQEQVRAIATRERGRARTGEQQARVETVVGMQVVRLWARAQKISETRAVIEIALLVNLITMAEAVQLRRGIGGGAGLALESDRPRWDRVLGELRVGDGLARRIARPSVARNIVTILDTFEREGWPEHVSDPLPRAGDKQRLREAVASLNKGLEILLFRTADNGTKIACERR